MGRKRLYETVYRCPSCGRGHTAVVVSTPFRDMIMRKRRCLLCGEEHTTCEFPCDVANILRAMMETIADGKKAAVKSSE